MPRYRIQTPDGATYEVNAPEGATQDDVLAYVRQQHAGAAAVALPAAPAADTAPAPAVPEPSLLQQVGRAFNGAGRAVARGAAGLVDIPINAANGLVQAAGGRPGYFQTASGLIDRGLDAAGVPAYQPADATERVVGGVEEGLGGLLGGMGLGGVLAGSGGAGARTLGEALTGAPRLQLAGTVAGTGLAGIANESGATPAQQMEVGVLGGLIPAGAAGLESALGAAGRAAFGRPSAETIQLAQRAQAAGIPLNAAQVSDSRVARLLDSITGQVPFSGAQAFRNQQQGAFNRAVGQTIGANADAITPPVFDAARGAIGSEFDRLTAANDLPLSAQLMQRLKSAQDSAGAYFGTDAQRTVGNLIDRVIDQSQNGVLPGRAYGSIDSELGRALAAGGERTVPLGDVREALRDAMGQQLSPDDAAAWQQARQQWRDLKTIEPLVAKSPEGDISPAQLLGRVVADRSGKAAMARGTRGDLGDLAMIGQRFVKSTVPDSGTAQRTAAINALKGIGPLVAGAAGGAAVGSPLQAILAAAGTAAGARATQAALRNPALIDALLGNAPAQNRLLLGVGQSLDPTYQAERIGN